MTTVELNEEFDRFEELMATEALDELERTEQAMALLHSANWLRLKELKGQSDINLEVDNATK